MVMGFVSLIWLVVCLAVGILVLAFLWQGFTFFSQKKETDKQLLQKYDEIIRLLREKDNKG